MCAYTICLRANKLYEIEIELNWYLLVLLLKFDSINRLDFLLEDGSLTFASNIKIKDFDLYLLVKFTVSDITTFQTSINNSYTDFMAHAFVKGTTGALAQGVNIQFMKEGLVKCTKTVNTALALLKYLNNNTTKPEVQTCMKICKPIDVEDFKALQGKIELEGAKLTSTWTAADVE